MPIRSLGASPTEQTCKIRYGRRGGLGWATVRVVRTNVHKGLPCPGVVACMATRSGYYALPILYGDRLAASSTPPSTGRPGCCGSTPSTRTLPFTKAMNTAIHQEIESLANLLSLKLQLP
jgi:hypothetical protein